MTKTAFTCISSLFLIVLNTQNMQPNLSIIQPNKKTTAPDPSKETDPILPLISFFAHQFKNTMRGSFDHIQKDMQRNTIISERFHPEHHFKTLQETRNSLLVLRYLNKKYNIYVENIYRQALQDDSIKILLNGQKISYLMHCASRRPHQEMVVWYDFLSANSLTYKQWFSCYIILNINLKQPLLLHMHKRALKGRSYDTNHAYRKFLFNENKKIVDEKNKKIDLLLARILARILFFHKQPFTLPFASNNSEICLSGELAREAKRHGIEVTKEDNKLLITPYTGR